MPVTPERLERARSELDAVVEAVAARHREELAPAIERVWFIGISSPATSCSLRKG